MKIPNLAFIRSLALRGTKPDTNETAPIPGSEGLGSRLYEALKYVEQWGSGVEQQANINPDAGTSAPPAINGVTVTTGPGGEFQVAISDQNQINRGINYFVEHADNPAFNGAHVIDVGQSRNHSVYLGKQTLYWRAYSAYPGGPPGQPQYHGSQAAPRAVIGGVIGSRAPAMGSGTGAVGQALQGPGPVQTRSESAGFDWTRQGNARGQGR